MQQTSWSIDGWNISVCEEKSQSRKIVLPKQIHGAAICTIDELQRSNTPMHADGVITEGSAAAIRTADCLPLILIGTTSALALHVSRKTLIQGQLETLPKHFDTTTIQTAWLGPHICEDHCVFEYQGEEITDFMEKFPNAYTPRTTGIHLSLRKATTHYLREWGIASSDIFDTQICTYENDLPSWKMWREKNGPVTPFPQFLTIVERQ